MNAKPEECSLPDLLLHLGCSSQMACRIELWTPHPSKSMLGPRLGKIILSLALFFPLSPPTIQRLPETKYRIRVYQTEANIRIYIEAQKQEGAYLNLTDSFSIQLVQLRKIGGILQCFHFTFKVLYPSVSWELKGHAHLLHFILLWFIVLKEMKTTLINL